MCNMFDDSILSWKEIKSDKYKMYLFNPKRGGLGGGNLAFIYSWGYPVFKQRMLRTEGQQNSK